VTGIGIALGGVVVAITEGDWVAATVFVIPAVFLSSAARRNAIFRRDGCRTE
jgi:hypothetical protein